MGTIYPMNQADKNISTGAQRLNKALDARRDKLGLTWDEVAERAGIKEQTLRHIRFGRTEDPRPSSVKAIEDAVGWERGSIERVRQGGRPRFTKPADDARGSGGDPGDSGDPPAIPGGTGFRSSTRPDGLVDYWMTIEVKGRTIDLHIPDVDGLGEESVRRDMEKLEKAARFAMDM